MKIKCEHERCRFSTAKVIEDNIEYECGFYWCLDCDMITRKIIEDKVSPKTIEWAEKEIKRLHL